jgi:phage terminase large subunit
LTRKFRREVPRVYAPLLESFRYKGAHGGRGSGKSHFFAESIIEDSLYHRGLRTLCIREVLKSLAGSSKRLLEDKIQSLGVGGDFVIFDKAIETPGGGLIEFEGMQNHNAETIKSKEGVNRVWIEEAQTLSERSLSLLRPTIRATGSEIWASWNRTRKNDAVDKFLTGPGTENDKEIKVVTANWRDNPWFPDELEKERKRDLQRFPERYEHIWEGDYARAFEGAYFAASHGREE